MNQLFREPVRNVLPYDGYALIHQEFLTTAVASHYFSTLKNEIDWEEHDLILFGKKIREPRLSAWIADDNVSYTYSGKPRQAKPWTQGLFELRKLCEETAKTRFNSVLANLYRDGLDSLAWHADDEPENGKEPVIASLSFGATRRFDLKHNTTHKQVNVSLEHGTLLVMGGLSQECWKHRVPRTTRVLESRINLTFRWVSPTPLDK